MKDKNKKDEEESNKTLRCKSWHQLTSNVSVLGSFRKSKTDGKILFQSVFFIAIF